METRMVEVLPRKHRCVIESARETSTRLDDCLSARMVTEQAHLTVIKRNITFSLSGNMGAADSHFHK